MRIHPELRALRGDDTPQRDAQEGLVAALAPWRAQPPVAALYRELGEFAEGGAIGAYPRIAALFDPVSPATGRAMVDDLVSHAARGLASHRLGHMPFRHFCDDGIATIQLARIGSLILTLNAIDGATLAKRPAQTTVDFQSAEIFEHVLAGEALADAVACANAEAGRADLDVRPVRLARGMVIARRAREQALVLREVSGTLVTLRLLRRERNPRPTREFRLSDGCLVHQAAGNVADSRCELIMALLRRMDWREAAPEMARIARGEGSPALRWQALRECLALDTATGFAALTALARDPADDLAHSAGALRSQLIETYPQLKEHARCPG